MILPLTHFLSLSITLFILGLTGIILNRRNIIIILISIELILLAVNLNFIVYAVFLDDLIGEIFALFVLTVAAAESAIGLAILVVYFRVRGSIDIGTISLIQGLFFLPFYLPIFLPFYLPISLPSFDTQVYWIYLIYLIKSHWDT